MTKVDFYILQGVADIEERSRFACRIVNKAFKQGHEVLLHTNDATHCEQLDQMLWREPSAAFIPHTPLKEAAASVNVGYGSDPGEHYQVLVNLADSVPEFFSRFKRVVEIVIFEPRIRELTRANYTFYKDRGLPLNSHNIS